MAREVSTPLARPRSKLSLAVALSLALHLAGLVAVGLLWPPVLAPRRRPVLELSTVERVALPHPTPPAGTADRGAPSMAPEDRAPPRAAAERTAARPVRAPRPAAEPEPLEVASLDAEAADALLGAEAAEPGPRRAKGEGVRAGEKGRGKGRGADLFPKDVLEAIVLKGEEEGVRVKRMLARYVGDLKARHAVRAGLVPPWVTKLGSRMKEAWAKEILPPDKRTLKEGVRRWFKGLKEAPGETVRSLLGAYASFSPYALAKGLDTTTLIEEDMWERGRGAQARALIGVRADGSLIDIRFYRRRNFGIFDGPLRTAARRAAAEVGSPPAEIAGSGEVWTLWDLKAGIIVLPPTTGVSASFDANFTDWELLHPFKIIVETRAELLAYYASPGGYDPTFVDPAEVGPRPKRRPARPAPPPPSPAFKEYGW